MSFMLCYKVSGPSGFPSLQVFEDIFEAGEMFHPCYAPSMRYGDRLGPTVQMAGAAGSNLGSAYTICEATALPANHTSVYWYMPR
jgi:hypothetical protein